MRMWRTFVSLLAKKQSGPAILGNSVALVRWLSGRRCWSSTPGAPESKEETDFQKLSSDLHTCIHTHD